MEITKEYYDENVDVVDRNYKAGRSARHPLRDTVRYKIIRKFCEGAKTILSVGCGGREARLIGATHACDIVPNSEEYLRKDGWDGKFKLASCTNLPFPDNSFDVVVCSEVIEHLPLLSAVQETFDEVSRVGNRWIITTPRIKNPEKTHKHLFSLRAMETFSKDLKVKIFGKDIYWFIQSVSPSQQECK